MAEDAERAAFRFAVTVGLCASPKRLPGKYLWDEAGSHLFDRICDHPDYYPTRSETALLPNAARDIAALVGPGATIVEFGSGASREIRTLLDALDRPARYVAVDISRAYLEAAVARLRPDYPEVEMVPVYADYGEPLHLPLSPLGSVPGFFLGTSIGNGSPAEARGFLERARAMLGGHRLLVGTDPTQDAALLKQVYGDCRSLMPALHLNILTRLERELGARIEAGAFRHAVRVLPDPFRVEAGLVATHATSLHLDGQAFAVSAGERIRTDTSHKYTPDAFGMLAADAGWRRERLWFDTQGRFCLHLLAG